MSNVSRSIPRVSRLMSCVLALAFALVAGNVRGDEPVACVTLAVDLRPSPRALANEGDFLPITYDGGDWCGASSSAAVTVSRDGAAAKTLVNSAAKAGSLVFTAIGPGRYVFTHTANGENLTAEFDLAAGEATGGDVATLAFDSRVFTAAEPRVVNDLAEDLWPVTFSATGWAKEGAGAVAISLAGASSPSVVVKSATGEGQFALMTAATGLSTLTHQAGAATETAYLMFGEDMKVKIDTNGDGEADTEVSAFGGETWLDPAVAPLITAIEPDPADATGWLVTFDPAIRGGINNFDAWYAASVLNGRIALKTATAPSGLTPSLGGEVRPMTASGGRVKIKIPVQQCGTTFWQVEVK